MSKLERSDLWTLEAYAGQRSAFRAEVIEHKKPRRVVLHPNATMYFEDRTTIRYQLQEMLRIERIFEAAEIEEELATYNPLIPDGKNWKATFMLEYEDVAERRQRLSELIGVESAVWVKVNGFDPVPPIYNEDLERSTEDKTSSVHFMRFELTDEMIKALQNGASVAAGIDHPAYNHTVDPIPDNVLKSLLNDLD